VSSMNLNAFFSDSYADARQKFLAACEARGAPVISYPHPLRGAEGEALFTDVARIGPEHADRVLVVESALHGVEGYTGSAIQIAALASSNAPQPPEGVALLLVHAINPWGFSWNRRFNEDNIDLNRHFLNWENPGKLDNPGYDDLASALVPREITPEAMAEADAVMERYKETHGKEVFRTAIKRGQYKHPDGLFYGGLKPSWSALTVERIAKEHLSEATWAGLIDIHTGLGPFGVGECLSGEAPDSDEGRRASSWYGHVAHTKSPKTDYAGSEASILDGYKRAAPWLVWTPVGLEFGTREEKVVRDAVRMDGWLHLYGSPEHPLSGKVKKNMLYAYYPAEPEWRAAIVERGLEVVRLGLAGLAAQERA